MTDLAFRRAGPPDAEIVDALTKAAYAKWVALLGRKPRPMTADYKLAVVEHQIDLLDIEGRLAALIELCFEPDHLLIVNIAVHPDRQGQGVGRKLLDHAELVAKEASLAELRLYANSLMAVNIAFYLSHGYRVDREEPSAPLGLVTYMSKRLAR